MEQYQNEEEKQVSALMKEGGEEEEAWGTWEELLLACAVKRHGVEDWDSVAMEVQGKNTSLSHLHTITAFNCKQKYHDLQRRFHQDEDEQEEEDSDPIPWLHHLKNLRLAQLRHDLNHYDVSITSLETKVKRLEEERKLHEETKPDLEEHNSKRHGSNSRSEDTLNDKEEKNGQDRFKQENQSANGSNSTCSKTQEDHHHLHNENNNKISSLAEPEAARAGQSDSDNGSCETVRRRERESGSSEAQSSASLTRQRRRMLELKGQRSEQVEEKSKPLATVLEKIREHEHGYLFERRLTSQERDEYKSMVHQHVDLANIEAKLQNRTDSSSESTYSALQFYRDLLVLFTNAVVFFPKSSAESMAANQLRRLVLNEMNESNFISTRSVHPSSNSLPSQSLLPKLELKRSDSLLAKHKSTTPIFVCRKRSSITSKPSSIARMASTTADHRAAEALGASDVKPLINSKANIAEEDNVSASAAAAKADEKPVTGTVSSRTAITDHEINAKDSSTKKTFAGPSETPKGGRKRKTPEEEPATPSNKRRSGAAAAADFLKRLKRNSPAKQKVNLKSGTGTSSGAEQKKRGGNNKKPHDKVKERVSKQSGGDTKKQVKEESSPSKRSVGRPSKKAADTSANMVSAKRSRENVAKQQQQRPPRKRSRR